jgi:ABC-2 type transport system permease protein
MSMPAAPPAPAVTARLRWVLSDALVITKRNLITVPRVLEILVFATIQPVMFTLLFAYVFGGAISLPGGGSYREYLMAGVFGLTLAFTSTRTAVSLATDMQQGLLDRFRSLPMSRSAVLAGRTTADLALTAVTIAVTSASGLAVGWRIHDGPGKAAAGFALLFLLGYALSWAGAAIGMSVRTPEAATQAVLTWLFPLAFISSAFVPTQGMPHWMQYIAAWNPISATAAACRQLWGNPQSPLAHPTWLTSHPALLSAAWSVIILACASALSIRKYRALLDR